MTTGRGHRRRSRRRHDSSRAAASIAEVLVVIGVVGMLVSLTAPAVLSSRERGRGSACANNLRQLALAAHSHEATHGSFPSTATAWIDNSTSPPRRHHAVSPHRSLVRWLDPAAGARVDFDDPADPIWARQPPGHFVSAGHRELQRTRLAVFMCPSDAAAAGATNYRANLGISSEVLPPSGTIEETSQRGAFVNGRAVRPSEFTDGLSHTALFAERVVGDDDPDRYFPFRDIFATGASVRGTDSMVVHCDTFASLTPDAEYSFAGGSWLLGGWLNTWYSHALTPNSATSDCGLGPAAIDGGWVVVAARSFHPGGVYVAMADGSVWFVAGRVDLDVWRAAGTRNGDEPLPLD